MTLQHFRSILRSQLSPARSIGASPFNPQRRRFLWMAAGAAMAAACSDPEGRSLSTPSSTATKRVSHAFGKTEIPVAPSRIVVSGFLVVEAVLALGIEPIGAPGDLLDSLQHLPTPSRAIANVGQPREPSLEKIASLQPDLILTSREFTTAAAYPLLSQIAPTVVFDVEGYTDWQAIARLCGEALDKEAEVARLEADYAAKVQALQAQLPRDPAQIEVAMALFRPDRITTIGRKTFPGSILADVGLSRPPRQADSAMFQLSFEKIEDLDADVLLVFAPQTQTAFAAQVRTGLDEIKDNPLWAQLDVVQAQQVYEVGSHWSGAGYIAAQLVLDDLQTFLVGSPG